MGLYKSVELPNGITVSYHRIAGVHIITNNTNNIDVLSYITKAKRDEEIAALEEARNSENHNYPHTDIFIHSSTIDTPYDQTMTIASAYEYLKEHEGYEDADDVFEEGQPEDHQEEA